MEDEKSGEAKNFRDLIGEAHEKWEEERHFGNDEVSEQTKHIDMTVTTCKECPFFFKFPGSFGAWTPSCDLVDGFNRLPDGWSKGIPGQCPLPDFEADDERE